ncbi:MAG: helix-turn-helix domain-containing protein [Christensenellales bacterium]
MNILIVDDDILIRNWLSMLIHEIKDYDIHIFSVGDTFAAMDCCCNNPIDLVITDISMPHKTGLQLIEMLNIQYPYIKTAVLSAYNNYEYIRHALKLGALDYILKPEMKLDDVTALLKKVTMFAELRHSSDTDYTNFDNDNRAFTRFLNNLNAEAGDLFKDLSIPLDPNNLVIFVLRLENTVDDRYAYFPLQNVCNKTLASEMIRGVSIGYGDDMLIILYEPRSSIAEYRKTDQTKLELLFQRNMKSFFKKNISCSINQICRESNALRRMIQDCLLLMEMYRYYPDAQITMPFKNLSDDDMILFNQKIRQKLELHQTEEAVRILRELIEKLHADLIVPKDIKTAIVYAVTIMFANVSFSLSNTAYNIDYNRFIKTVNLVKSRLETENIIEEFAQYYQHRHQKVNLNISPPIKQAIEYINKNYMKKITLESVASHIYLNKTYVSQLYKKQLNMSFGEYLEEVRISKAKNLLSNSYMSITQIAEEVGYTSQSYFTKVFKKKTGMGPLKYRAIVIPGSFDEPGEKE